MRSIGSVLAVVALSLGVFWGMRAADPPPATGVIKTEDFVLDGSEPDGMIYFCDATARTTPIQAELPPVISVPRGYRITFVVSAQGAVPVGVDILGGHGGRVAFLGPGGPGSPFPLLTLYRSVTLRLVGPETGLWYIVGDVTQ